MRIRTRILIGFILLYAIGSYFVFDMIISDIRPRYLEAVEESLNDTANLLASLLESDMEKYGDKFTGIKSMFGRVTRKKIAAQIYGLKKTDVNLQVYVTDERGIVRYDSNGGAREGMDFSRWNDVYRTLHGAYGARSSLTVGTDPSSKALHVSAPVRRGGAVIGVVTVVKPENSVALFMELAKRKIVVAAVLSGAAFIVLGVLLTLWINRPIAKLHEYVRSLKSGARTAFPRLSAAEIRSLGLAFEEMRTELEGKDYIERYIQSLTHELKSPLSSIRGAAELLDDDMSVDQKRKFHRNIRREAERIDSIIEKLLQLTALEKRKQLDHIQTLSLGEIVSEAIASLEPQVMRSGVFVQNNVPVDHEVCGEKFLVTHAVLNLVNNALRFTPAGGAVSLSSTLRNGFIVLTVSDTGAGIPDFARDKIFDRFYSLPGADDTRGTGLGLPFVCEVAHLHGGTIEVKNNVNGPGVTATLTLPGKVSAAAGRNNSSSQ